MGQRPEESEELLHSPGVFKFFKQNKERLEEMLKVVFAVMILILPFISEEKIDNVWQEEEQETLSHLVAATEKLECLKEHGRSDGERRLGLGFIQRNVVNMNRD